MLWCIPERTLMFIPTSAVFHVRYTIFIKVTHIVIVMIFYQLDTLNTVAICFVMHLYCQLRLFFF